MSRRYDHIQAATQTLVLRFINSFTIVASATAPDSTVVSKINFAKQTCFSLGTFPSLQRGGCGINQKSRSHRRAADGVVAQATRFTNAFRSVACERPPRPRFFSERIHFANGASTPPLQGGECTYPKSVSNMKWDTTLERSGSHCFRLRPVGLALRALRPPLDGFALSGSHSLRS